MPYEGDLLNQCGLIQTDFSTSFIVAVSGDGPNICGHLLIYASKSGCYFHAVGDPDSSGIGKMRGYPRYLLDSGYRRYLQETGKTELRRLKVTIPNPRGAALYLERLMSEPWTWGVLPNNCVAFVEEVIRAGGGSWGSYSNCPTIATADTLTVRIASFLSGLEGSIYSAYGM
jgi:hypothetical protein